MENEPSLRLVGANVFIFDTNIYKGQGLTVNGVYYLAADYCLCC